MADCQTYVKAIANLHLYPPCVIIAPHTFFKLSGDNGPTRFTSLLLDYLQDEFAVAIEPLDRKYWSAEAGMLCAPVLPLLAPLMGGINRRRLYGTTLY